MLENDHLRRYVTSIFGRQNRSVLHFSFFDVSYTVEQNFFLLYNHE